MSDWSHPATQQDDWVLSKLGNWPNSTYVELGAYDGMTHSNTWMLQYHGWTGHLIEGCKEFYEQCKKNRPESQVHHAVVGRGDETEQFVIGGQYSGIVRTMPDEFVREHLRRGNEVITVNTRCLSAVVGLGPFTYLSVDTEGNEYEILADWFGAGGEAKAISVEFRYDEDFAHRLTRLMDDFGYYLDEVRGFDLCFLRT